jgi:integrase
LCPFILQTPYTVIARSLIFNVFIDFFANFLQTIGMGRFAKNTTVEVIEGLYIKPSNKSPYWQTYCHIDGKTFRKSTKCKDEEQAKLVAAEWFYDIKRDVAAGVSHSTVSFQKLFDVYMSFIQHDGKYAFHFPTAERHFLPFFSKFTDIKKITLADINDYLDYRRNKNAEPPLPQTLNRENTILRQMLSHAVKQGWLKEAVTIENMDESQSRRRRPHFTHKEYRTLYTVARSRIARLRGEDLRQYTLWQRQLLYDVIMFMANTGLRVDEMKTVIWRNVDIENGYVQLIYAGKVKSNRRVIVRRPGINALKRIRKRREEWLDAKQIEDPINPSERVIALPDAVPVDNFKKSFNSLIEECGFVYKTKHEKHVMTSLRHTYATFSLTRKEGKRATMRALAMQMGTSERMIQRHYGHDEIMDYEDELRGE